MPARLPAPVSHRALWLLLLLPAIWSVTARAGSIPLPDFLPSPVPPVPMEFAESPVVEELLAIRPDPLLSLPISNPPRPDASDTFLLATDQVPRGHPLLGFALTDRVYRAMAPKKWGLRTGLRQLGKGRCQEAHEAFLHYLESATIAGLEAEPLLWDAFALICLDDEAAARSRFEEVIEEFPESPLHAMAAFNAGFLAFRMGEPGFAADHFRRFLADHARHPEADQAVYLLGCCLLELDDLEGADRKLQELITRFPLSRLKPDAQFWRGVILERQGQQGRAEAAYRSFAQNYQDHRQAALALLGRARCLAATGDPRAALLQHQEFLRRYPENDHALAATHEIAWLAASLGMPDRARPLLNRLRRRSEPEWKARADLLEAWLIDRGGDRTEAVRRYRAYLVKHPGGFGAFFARFHAAAALGDGDDPVRAAGLLRRLALDRDAPREIRLPAALSAAGFLVQARQAPRATSMLDLAEALAPEEFRSGWLPLWRGEILLQAGAGSRAGPDLQRALDGGQPGQRNRALQGLIRAHIQEGDWAEARRWALRATRETSGGSEPGPNRLLAGQCSARLELPDQALSDLLPLLMDGSDQVRPALLVLSRLGTRIEHPTLGLEALALAGGSFSDPEIDRLRGMSLLELGEPEAALTLLRTAREGTGVVDPVSLEARGAALYNLGCFDEALAFLSGDSEESVPGSSYGQGLCLLAMGRPGEFAAGADHFVQGREGEPRIPLILNGAAQELTRRGQDRAADTLRLLLLETYPGAPLVLETRYQLARRAARAGDHAAAEQHLSLLLEADSSGGVMAEALLDRAAARRQLGRIGPARDDLERLVSDHPDHPLAPGARLRLAEAFLAEGDRTRALAALDEMVARDSQAPETYEAFLLIGQLEDEAGALLTAREAFHRAAESPQPGISSRAWTALGRQAARRGEWGRALELLLTALDRSAGAGEGVLLEELYREAAQAAESSGDPDRAAELYRRARETTSKAP